MAVRYPVDIKLNNRIDELNILENHNYDFYTEAVFKDGRAKIKPIEDQFQILKDEVDRFKKEEIVDSQEYGKYVDTYKLWRSVKFKDLEDTIKDIFGFRFVIFDILDDNALNDSKKLFGNNFTAYTSINNRYPIDGLITDEGFYDKTHSIGLKLTVSTWYLDNLTAPELTAVTLHEIGHNIDPAVIDITFAQTDLITDYILKRKPKKSTAKVSEKYNYNKISEPMWALISIWNTLKQSVSSLSSSITSNSSPRYYDLPPVESFFRKLFMSKRSYGEWVTKEYLAIIQDVLNRDKSHFDYIHYKEAFADNFARMYGYGYELAEGFHKCEKYLNDLRMSRVSRENDKKRWILSLIISSLTDVHKTDIHRFQSLIEEYDKDINNPNTPDDLKAQLIEEKEKLVALQKLYTTDFGEFYNRCNQMISEFVQNQDVNINEEFFDLFNKGNMNRTFNNSDELTEEKVNEETNRFFDLSRSNQDTYFDTEGDHHDFKRLEWLRIINNRWPAISSNPQVVDGLYGIDENSSEENIMILKNIVDGEMALYNSYYEYICDDTLNSYDYEKIFNEPFNLELIEKIQSEAEEAMRKYSNPKYPFEIKFIINDEYYNKRPHLDEEDINGLFGEYVDYFKTHNCLIGPFIEASVDIKNVEVCEVNGNKYYTTAIQEFPKWMDYFSSNS